MLETLLELVQRYRAWVILVEVAERSFKMALLQVIVALQARRNELSVVNVSVLVRVDHIHGFLEVFVGQLAPFNLLDSFFELIDGKFAVTIFVKLTESFSQGFDLVLWYPWGYEGQSGSLEVHAFHVIPHVHDHIRVYHYLWVFFPLLHLDPGVVESFLRCEPKIGLPL